MAQEPPNVPNAPQPSNMGGDQRITTASFHETQDLNEIQVLNFCQRLEEMTEQIGQLQVQAEKMHEEWSQNMRKMHEKLSQQMKDMCTRVINSQVKYGPLKWLDLPTAPGRPLPAAPPANAPPDALEVIHAPEDVINVLLQGYRLPIHGTQSERARRLLKHIGAVSPSTLELEPR